jgi:hypothetical protein
VRYESGMDPIGIVVLALVIVAVIAVVVRIKPKARPADGPEEPEAAGEIRIRDGVATVSIDIQATDTSSPVVQRLVQDAAVQVFTAHPEVTQVKVNNASGTQLGSVSREIMDSPEVAMPAGIVDPRARHGGPGASDQGGAGAAHVGYEASDEIAHRALADRFDLPATVRQRLTDPDDIKALVKALLEGANLQYTQDGDLFKVGNRAIVVIDTELGRVVPDDALSNAFIRFQSSGARSGFVVTPGLMYPQDLKRRQTMAPQLKHAGPEGIQRMADAVELGADPIRFATGPLGD